MDFDKAAARILFLREQIKAYEAEVKELIGEMPSRTGEYVAGDLLVKVSPTLRFDAATAKRNLSPELFEQIVKPTPNSALAKAVLDESEYALCQRDYGVSVRITRPEDD